MLKPGLMGSSAAVWSRARAEGWGCFVPAHLRWPFPVSSSAGPGARCHPDTARRSHTCKGGPGGQPRAGELQGKLQTSVRNWDTHRSGWALGGTGSQGETGVWKHWKGDWEVCSHRCQGVPRKHFPLPRPGLGACPCPVTHGTLQLLHSALLPQPMADACSGS